MNLASGNPTRPLRNLNTERFNTSLLDNLTTAVVVMDSELSLYHLNPSAEVLLETSNRHCHAIKMSELFRNPEDFLRALETVQQTNTTVIIRKVEFVLLGGSKLVVDFSLAPITHLGLTHYLMELQEINRSWSISRKETLISNHETTVEMIRGLSHEIKNPLGGIRSAAQLLAAELPDPQLRDYTNVIIEETDRLVNLVDRLTGPYKKPSIAPLNIHEVLERVRSLVEAETKGAITIVRDYDPSLPEVHGDIEQLIQAVLNVVRNAMQALTENKAVGKTKPKITLRTRAVSHTTLGSVTHRLVARIEIIDNGPGIPPEISENIFYPLISGRAEGTGLGLSIAQNILKNHRGLIECESQPGRTSFILSIPLNEPAGDYA
jgi:two-component system nitrogen regulation sensor histidine kinase GlnL